MGRFIKRNGCVVGHSRRKRLKTLLSPPKSTARRGGAVGRSVCVGREVAKMGTAEAWLITWDDRRGSERREQPAIKNGLRRRVKWAAVAARCAAHRQKPE